MDDIKLPPFNWRRFARNVAWIVASGCIGAVVAWPIIGLVPRRYDAALKIVAVCGWAVCLVTTITFIVLIVRATRKSRKDFAVLSSYASAIACVRHLLATDDGDLMKMIQTITYETMAAELKQLGWQHVPGCYPADSPMQQWGRARPDDVVALDIVAVPSRQDAPDYAARVLDVVEMVAATEREAREAVIVRLLLASDVGK